MDDSPDTRILLVEDEAPILAGLSELFQSQGFAPDTAADGVSALEQWADKVQRYPHATPWPLADR